MKIKVNDKVKVMSGKDKGKESKVLRVLHEENKIVVENVNMVKKHVKPGTISKEGGIISMEKPINVSNVMLLCSKCGKPTRVGYKIVKDKKYRACRKCGEVLDK